MKQILVKVLSSPRNIIENKITIYCPFCARVSYEFDLNSEIKEVNCSNCRSQISVENAIP